MMQKREVRRFDLQPLWSCDDLRDPRYCIFWIAYQVVTRLRHGQGCNNCNMSQPRWVSWCLLMPPDASWCFLYPCYSNVTGRVANICQLCCSILIPGWYPSKKLTLNIFELKVIGFAVMRVIGALFLNETPPDCTDFEFGIPIWVAFDFLAKTCSWLIVVICVCLLDHLNLTWFHSFKILIHDLSSHLPSAGQRHFPEPLCGSRNTDSVHRIRAANSDGEAEAPRHRQINQDRPRSTKYKVQFIRTGCWMMLNDVEWCWWIWYDWRMMRNGFPFRNKMT